jgi:hypothetical protein
VKKAVRWLIAAVVVVFIVQNPAEADALAHHIAAAVSEAAQSLSRLVAGL